MSEALLSGIAEYLPKAKVTLDRFHIIKRINEAVTAVRRRERREQPFLQGAQYSVLKRPDHLNEKDRALLADMEERNLETARAYHIRLLFDDYFSQVNAAHVRGFLKGWVTKATQSGIEDRATVAGTDRKHWKMIVNWTRTQQNNGTLEGFNSLLQAMKASARRC